MIISTGDTGAKISPEKSAWHHISNRTGVRSDWSVSGSLVNRKEAQTLIHDQMRAMIGCERVAIRVMLRGLPLTS